MSVIVIINDTSRKIAHPPDTFVLGEIVMIPHEIDGIPVYCFHLTSDELWHYPSENSWDGFAGMAIRFSSSHGDLLVPSFAFKADGKCRSRRDVNPPAMPKDEWIIPYLKDAITWAKSEKYSNPVAHLIYRYDIPGEIGIMINDQLCTPNP